jgi:DNA-binding transcriptional LysR family regulator
LEAAERQDLIEERLRLGVTELVACTWLQTFLRLLRQEYPNLRVELEVDLSRQIEERLREGRLDLALQNGPFAFQATGEKALAEEPYVWVANTDLANELAGGTSVARFFDKAVLTHARHTSAARALWDRTLIEILRYQEPPPRIGFFGIPLDPSQDMA